jgi:hypothetical protein
MRLDFMSAGIRGNLTRQCASLSRFSLHFSVTGEFPIWNMPLRIRILNSDSESEAPLLVKAIKLN